MWQKSSWKQPRKALARGHHSQAKGLLRGDGMGFYDVFDQLLGLLRQRRLHLRQVEEN